MGIITLDNKILMSGNQMALYIPLMPKKGDILNLDLDGKGEKQYRVLKMNGNVAQVMAMYDTLTSIWDESYSKTATMGTLTVAKYEGSDIDTYLNTTWYNTLTNMTKAAIVPENVVCDAWYGNDTGDPNYTGTFGQAKNYTISKYAGGILNISSRNVFALGVQDVIDYLDDSTVQVDTTAILRNVNIWKMFWNDEVSHSRKYLWLRSASTNISYLVWSVSGPLGFLSTEEVGAGFDTVRPALNLNLSKVPFTIVS